MSVFLWLFMPLSPVPRDDLRTQIGEKLIGFALQIELSVDDQAVQDMSLIRVIDQQSRPSLGKLEFDLHSTALVARGCKWKTPTSQVGKERPRVGS
jgi:hypothetical protein